MDEKKHKMISQRSVATLLGGLILVLTILACALSPIFVLKTVNIQGNSYVNNDEIIRIAGVQIGENLFQLQTNEIRKNLTKDLRIEQAVVQRNFPSQLDISVSERLPVAMVPCNYGFLELGKDGMVIDAHRTLREMPVPIISGVTVDDLFVADVVDNDQVSKVLHFINDLQAETGRSLSEINISNPDDVILYAGSVQIRVGPLDMLPEKVQVTESVIREVKETRRPIDYVDARFNVYSVRLRQ